MDDYYFKLVCVDEQNPFGYNVIDDVNLPNLEAVQRHVEKHINDHIPERLKWMILPMKKSNLKIA